ncbi:hypothetical protein C8Q76DRAFT_727405 [Earliella scabrosa]|nr:hypothetical protein C8Q76DRAFT_727405 [Earliella scabrosa]
MTRTPPQNLHADGRWGRIHHVCVPHLKTAHPRYENGFHDEGRGIVVKEMGVHRDQVTHRRAPSPSAVISRTPPSSTRAGRMALRVAEDIRLHSVGRALEVGLSLFLHVIASCVSTWLYAPREPESAEFSIPMRSETRPGRDMERSDDRGTSWRGSALSGGGGRREQR